MASEIVEYRLVKGHNHLGFFPTIEEAMDKAMRADMKYRGHVTEFTWAIIGNSVYGTRVEKWTGYKKVTPIYIEPINSEGRGISDTPHRNRKSNEVTNV